MPALSNSSLNQNWFFRYKLYHLPFWFAYHYVSWVITWGNPVAVFQTIIILPYTIKYSFYVIFQAFAVYFNLYLLMPAYLGKSRFAPYFGYLLLTIMSATVCITGGYYFSAFISGKTIQELFGETACYYQFLGSALLSTMASMTLAMSIKLTRNWIKIQKQQQLLEKEKLETELKFLRNQFNPHFLFNTINSIFFLIHKNPDMASASLAKFSDLLRYQLYECNDQQIPLSNEIAYLENFIELERLRQNSNMQVTVTIEPIHAYHLVIAPFIVMTFVENAFKHVSRHSDRPNWITIKLAVAGCQLSLWVANSATQDTANEAVHYGGIGLGNVQRRLDLLYSGCYELDVQQRKDQFDVKLTLTLTELAPTPALLADGQIPLVETNRFA